MAKSIVSSFSFSKVVNEWRNIDVIIALKAINALHAVACWCLHDRCNDTHRVITCNRRSHFPPRQMASITRTGCSLSVTVSSRIDRSGVWALQAIRPGEAVREGVGGYRNNARHHTPSHPPPPSLESSYRRDDWHLINTWVAGLFSFSVSLAVLWIISPSLSSCRIWFGWIILANETLVTKNPTIMEHRGTESLD